MEPLGFLNTEYVPASQLKIGIQDAGFVWGATVTDRARTYQQKLFCWEEHLARFRNSCEFASIEIPLSDQEITEIAEHLVKVNHPDSESSVVLVATPGIKSLPIPMPDIQPTFLVHTIAISNEGLQYIRTNGIKLSPVVAPLGVNPQIKHRSRLNWWIAYVATFPCEPLLLAPGMDELVLETWNGNILMWKENTLYTSPSDWILNGISLQRVLEHATKNGIPVQERPFSIWELMEAEGVFVTNTTYGIAWVCELNEKRFPSPKENSVFTTLEGAFPN